MSKQCAEHKNELPCRLCGNAVMEAIVPARILRANWQADCPQCVGSKFTCDKHFKPRT